MNHRADLRFWYDGMGNRIRKRVIQPLVGGGADTTDTWYVRDPQGNPMAIYEQERVVDTLFTKVSEFAIYGAQRVGLCYADQLIRRECLSEQCASLEDVPVSTLRMLLVSEVMYDSPVSPDSLPFEEVHNGEYLRIANSSGREMSLDSVRLVCNGDTLALDGTLGMEEELLIGFATSAGEFHQITRVDTIGEDLRLVLQQSLALPDGGGEIEVWYGDSLVDRVLFGEFHGLVAENAYLADSLLDSLGQRSSLTILSRQTGSGRIVGPPVIGGSIGPISIGGTIQAEPVIQSWQGRYGLYRGRKAYEGTNHLGNVLAVVSDLKLGQESGTPDGIVDYYLADVVSLSDYWPFGAPLQERQFSSDRYRYGFQRQEHDDEVMGEGNAVSFKYRVHDPRVGRFMSVDPLAPEYPWNSTYVFSENRTLDSGELEGLERYFAPDGKYLGKVGESDEIRTVSSKYVWDYYMKYKDEYKSSKESDDPDEILYEKFSERAYKADELDDLLKAWGEEYLPKSSKIEYGMMIFENTFTDENGNKFQVFMPGDAVEGNAREVYSNGSQLIIGASKIAFVDPEIIGGSGLNSKFGWQRYAWVHTHPPFVKEGYSWDDYGHSIADYAISHSYLFEYNSRSLLRFDPEFYLKEKSTSYPFNDSFQYGPNAFDPKAIKKATEERKNFIFNDPLKDE